MNLYSIMIIIWKCCSIKKCVMDASWMRHYEVGRYRLLHDAFYNPLQLHHDYIYFYFHIILLWFIIWIFHIMKKKVNFKLNFMFFVSLKKKAWFIPILAARVGLRIRYRIGLDPEIPQIHNSAPFWNFFFKVV